MSLDVLFFCSLSAGFAGFSRLVRLLEAALKTIKNTPETVMVSGVIFSVAASAWFCQDCLLFYSLRNSVGNLEHRHILISTRAVEKGLVVAVEVHHGS